VEISVDWEIRKMGKIFNGSALMNLYLL